MQAPTLPTPVPKPLRQQRTFWVSLAGYLAVGAGLLAMLIPQVVPFIHDQRTVTILVAIGAICGNIGSQVARSGAVDDAAANSAALQTATGRIP